MVDCSIYSHFYLKDVLGVVKIDINMRRTLLMIAGTAFVCSLFVPNHVISSGDGGSVLMSDDLYPWIAMVCGLPCVSFAAPCGPSEIITQGEDGFIVPPEDIQGLAEKLELLMENENLRCEMGKKARSNIMRYSVDNIMQQWEKLLSRTFL